MANLTSQMLLNALKDNKSYSATQPFIQAISSGDDSAVEIINNVFLSVLGSDKVSLMTKLLVLRMFKDIFITGNLEMFDKIDPQVQQVIISAAAYNPKFRQKGKNDKETRGAMYFVDTQKRQKNAQSMQLGHSFVILATQIIKFFAAWLPLAPDEAPSRFAQTYQQLEALGVQFNSSIYFQPEQQKKFKKNYEQWRKKLTISSQNEKKETQSQKQHEKDKTKDDEIKVKDQNKAKDPKNKDIKMEKVQKTCAQQKSKANSAQEKQKEHKQQLQKIKKEYETRLTKQQQSKDKMLKLLTDENNQKLEKIKTETIKKQSQIVILQQKCIKLEQENANLRKNSEKLTKDQQRLQATRDSQDKNTIQQLINQKMELQTRLKQQISTNKQFSTRIRTLQLEIDTKNTLNHKLSDELKQIHQQKNGGVAEKEAEILNLKKSIQILQRQRQKDQIQIHMLREQINKKITQMDVFKKSISQQPQQKKDISFKQVPCQKLEQKVGGSQVQKGLFILNEESAQVTTENKKQCSFILQKLQKKRSSDVGNGFILGDNQNKESRSVANDQKKDVDINQMSLSKYLRTQLQNNKQNLVEADQKRKINNSLHKTESTKFRWDNHMSKQKNKTFQNTRQNLALKRTQNDFFRTGENFRKNRQIITSVFPFLKEYFPSINMESSPYFKSCCLLQEPTHHLFFSDQLIELRVIKSKIKSRKIQISLKNRAPYQIEIKLIAQSPQLEIKQVETVAKLNPFSEHRVTAYVQVTNLNFRFPFLNLTIGLGSRKQKNYRLPLPITLFDFTSISQSHQELANFSRFELSAYKRHRSERITLNSMLKNLPLCLPFLNFQQNPSTKFESTSIIKYNDLPQVQLKLSIINTEQYTQFQTQFVYTSKINESFSKVLLQVLMFIFI